MLLTAASPSGLKQLGLWIGSCPDPAVQSAWRETPPLGHLHFLPYLYLKAGITGRRPPANPNIRQCISGFFQGHFAQSKPLIVPLLQGG